MAEGVVPPKPKANEPQVEDDPLKHINTEDLNSMEMIFTRDLITYVMRRRIPIWQFGFRYGCISTVTPFSFRVRIAIENYLIKQDVKLYFLFARGFTGLPIDYHGFICMVSKAVDLLYPSLKSPNDLLCLIALFAQFTLLAYKRGVHMAPYYALVGIQDILYRYMQERNIDPVAFFSSLGQHAEVMIHGTPLELLEEIY